MILPSGRRWRREAVTEGALRHSPSVSAAHCHLPQRGEDRNRNPILSMACKRELTRRVNTSPSTCPYYGKYGSFRRPPVPRKQMLPAQRQRTQQGPTAEPRRARPDDGQKPEEQPGLLWNIFRSVPVD